MKKCSHCVTEKPDEAYRVRRNKSGSLYRMAKCRECELSADRALYRREYADDPEYRERRAERLREWRHSNPSYIAGYWSSYYEENREVIRLRTAKWHDENKDQSKAQRVNRKARERALAGADTVSGKFIKQLLAEQNHECAFCLASIETEYHIDHVVPLSKGGTHDRMNLQALCPWCNLSKGAMGPIELLIRRGFNFQNCPL